MVLSDDEYSRMLSDSGLVLPDRSLVGNVWAESELWAYIRNEARQRRDGVVAYSRMFSPGGEFDKDMARDVIAAVVSSKGAEVDREAAETASDVTPRHMLLFLKLV